MITLLQEALRLRRLGLAVHWLRGPRGGPEDGRGKRPVSYDWQRRPALALEQLTAEYRAGYNLGLHTGLVTGAAVPVVAIDIDGPAGLAFAQARGVPSTPIAAVTRQGEHRYYRHPGRGVFVPTRIKVEGHPLDIMADTPDGGANLVIPPSVHRSGFTYRCIGEPWTAEALARMPVFDLAWFPVPVAPPLAIPRRHPANFCQSAVRAREALQKMQPAVQGQNGSRACFIAALMLFRRFALDVPTVYDLMWRDYNPRCEPPWSEAQMWHKVTDAARSAGVAVPRVERAGLGARGA